MTGMAVLHYDDLCIDPNQRRAFVNGRVVEMTTMEFNILYYLASHPGWTFTREQLYQYAMPDDLTAGPESVTSRIYRIRKNQMSMRFKLYTGMVIALRSMEAEKCGSHLLSGTALFCCVKNLELKEYADGLMHHIVTSDCFI